MESVFATSKAKFHEMLSAPTSYLDNQTGRQILRLKVLSLVLILPISVKFATGVYSTNKGKLQEHSSLPFKPGLMHPKGDIGNVCSTLVTAPDKTMSGSANWQTRTIWYWKYGELVSRPDWWPREHLSQVSLQLGRLELIPTV